MKIIYSVILIANCWLMASCQTNSNKQNQVAGEVTQSGTINELITVEDYETKLNAAPGAQLIDVRTPEEFAKGHLKNALNFDINSSDFENQIKKLDKTKTVFVYCLSGGRSAAAAQKMSNDGFATIYNMQGGIMAWQSLGKPIEQGQGATSNAGLSMEAFSKLVSGDKYVLVDFSAVWCGPCQKLSPILKSIADKKKDKMVLLKLDADENKDLLIQKGISGIPYLELYKDGNLVWKHAGFIGENELIQETKL